jgi:serine/threonine protein kinase/ribosomal protein S27E
MSQRETSVGGSDRADLDAVLADYMRRLDAGEKIDPAAFVAANPQLAEGLRDYFSQVGAVERFAAAHDVDGAQGDGDAQPTIEHRPSSRKDSRELHIRCPHCSNFVEVVSDTPYEEICCSTCGSTFSLIEREEATRMAAPLKSISRFDLVTRLGVGGFGTVWKAHDRELDRTVAVKIPRRGQLAPAEIDQFFREARAAAQLRHPNIVPVHEVGRDGESLFIVSDFIRGVTLTDWLTGNPVSAREKTELCIPIAEALHHAHEQGIVHRDMKPSNIMIDESGRPYLTDFGLAKRELGEITMTVEGQILGTPGYMSPEQARGQGHWTDRRTDIYSFGVILFQLLTGELPFRGNAQMQIHARLVEDAPDPRKLNRHIPRDLATICLKCLEREPGRRYSTAQELAEEFNHFLRGEPIKARPISRPARLARWAKRKPWIAATAALTLFLAVAGPIAAINLERQRRQIATRLRERDDLIQSTKRQVDQAKATIDELTDKLAVWDGRATSSELWPPTQENAPRQILVSDLFDKSQNILASQLRAGKYEPEVTARGYLALATMAETVGNKSLARDYYEATRDALVRLQKQNPTERRFARAMAQCETRIAELSADDDRPNAAKTFEKARDMYEQLAAEQKSATLPQIEWLEAELNSAKLTGYESGEKNLLQADQIRSKLSSNWPRDPNILYRLACFLANKEPILTEPEDTQAAEKSSAAASPTSQ